MKTDQGYTCDLCREPIFEGKGNILYPAEGMGSFYHVHRACYREFERRIGRLAWFPMSRKSEHNQLFEKEMAWRVHGTGEEPEFYRSQQLLDKGEW